MCAIASYLACGRNPRSRGKRVQQQRVNLCQPAEATPRAGPPEGQVAHVRHQTGQEDRLAAP